MELFRSSHPEVLLEKVVLKICSKFTGEHPCQNVISIKLLCTFITITLRHKFCPVNLRHIFRTPFSKSTSGRLLQKFCKEGEILLDIYWFFNVLCFFRLTILIFSEFFVREICLIWVGKQYTELHYQKLTFMWN